MRIRLWCLSGLALSAISCAGGDVIDDALSSASPGAADGGAGAALPPSSPSASGKAAGSGTIAPTIPGGGATTDGGALPNPLTACAADTRQAERLPLDMF